MSLTASNRWQSKTNVADCVDFDVAFDSSYPRDGESFAALQNLNKIKGGYVTSKNGYHIELDMTNQKLKVFAPAPIIVHDETVTVTANVGYLKYPAAFIQHVSDGTSTCRAFLVIPSGLVPIAGTVAVNMGIALATGVFTKGQRTSLTFLAADTVTSVKVSYVTQAWKEVTDNVVQAKILAGAAIYGHAGLTFTAGTPDVLQMGEDMVAVQSVTWDKDGTYSAMTPLIAVGTVTNARTEVAVDVVKATTFAELLFNTNDNVNAAKNSVYVTYVRKPSTGFLSSHLTETSVSSA